MIEYLIKDTRDTRDYVLHLEKWLGASERIASVSASSKPATLKVERVKFTPTAVVVRVSGGGNREKNSVLISVTTTTGQVKVFTMGIYTMGQDGEALLMPVIRGAGSIVVADAEEAAYPYPEVTVSGSMVVYTTAQDGGDDPGDEPGTDPFPLNTVGRRITRPSGEVVRLKAINWFGAEGSNRVPNGLWAVGYKALIDQFKAWGFNAIRMPFAGNTFDGNDGSGVSFSFNPDLQSPTTPGKPKKPIEVMDILISYATAQGLMIVLDHHRRTLGDGPDGNPVSATYTKANWIATWTTLAQRYKANPLVVGADLHNEPYGLSWNDWASLAEECGDAIHAVAPDWLIIVEGVGTNNGQSYWWGGQLNGVITRPVVLRRNNKLVYSVHDYGQSVGTQPWLATDTSPVAGYPGNLPDVFRAAWGFILEQNIAPVWVGEFGGHFGVGSGGEVKPNGVLEKQWATQLITYMNSNEASFAYWCLNPNSGDTGGLLRNDWKTAQTHKITLLAPLLA